VENRYTALVRGSSAIFPRGYLWLIPVWFAVIAAAIKVKGHARLWYEPMLWYEPVALGALLLAALTLITVLSTIRNNAFLVDGSGIWLGLRGGARRRFGPRRRRNRHLPWSEVDRLRIVFRRYGARIDIFLPAPPPSSRGRAIWRVTATSLAAGLTVLIPLAYLFRSPAILRPHRNPHRYRIPLYDVSPEELRLALVPLVPPNLPIAVQPRWRTRAMRRLRRLRRSRLATAA
jgi:hypothetical protein